MAKYQLDPRVIDKIKDRVLGPQYDLSFALITSRESRSLNRRYRHKDKPTNVLSFPLDRTSGEIVIDQTIAKQEAKVMGQATEEHLLFLLIHGILHLKGFAHGSKMESKERQLLKIFSTQISNGQKHRRRIRHRNIRR